MATSTGNQLAQNISQRIEELKKVCGGLDERTASRAPAGRWSPNEILSHLWGPERSGHLLILEAFQKYVSTWMDSMGTAILFFEGTASADGKTITQECSYDDPIKGPMKCGVR